MDVLFHQKYQLLFQFTCSNLEADILSFDPENKMSLKLSRKLYFQLVDKGYHFELLYSPAIQDASKRQNLIHLSHLYHSFGKSKNVIMSSGAKYHYLIRSPYDIISLYPFYICKTIFIYCLLNTNNNLIYHLIN